MKRAIVLAGLVGAAMSSTAIADCTTQANKVTGSAINTLLNDKLLCGRIATGYTPGNKNQQWQQIHASIGSGNGTGTLTDYKEGPNDKIDPTKVVGTWSKNGNVVTYFYNAFTPTATIEIDGIFRNANGTYSFCYGTREWAVAFIINNGGAGCQGNFP